MKIRRYFIENYIISILSVIVMYSIIGYGCFISKKYIGIFCIVMLAFLLLNRKIILYEDRAIIFQGHKKIEIEFDCIKSLKIGDYKPKFSKVSLPAIYAKMKDNKRKIFYYTSYSNESIIEIIEYALKKNNRINLDSNINELIKNRESEYDIRYRKKSKQTFILMIVSIVIGIIFYNFGK